MNTYLSPEDVLEKPEERHAFIMLHLLSVIIHWGLQWPVGRERRDPAAAPKGQDTATRQRKAEQETLFRRDQAQLSLQTQFTENGK